MIPESYVTAWSVDHPWGQSAQVEQDLLLSRAICAIALHPYLGEELVFRGGTALHKLHLDSARRYSEDLDYVRRSSGGIGELTRALTDLGADLGFAVSTKMSAQPKVLWRTKAADGSPIRLKIEVNTHERSPALPPIRLRHEVDSPWWKGAAKVQTFQAPELVATKIRALYQRSKGRDLYDLWLALDVMRVAPEEILQAFEPYRPPALTAGIAMANLKAKVQDSEFRHDLDLLIRPGRDAYSVDSAALVISDVLLSRL